MLGASLKWRQQIGAPWTGLNGRSSCGEIMWWPLAWGWWTQFPGVGVHKQKAGVDPWGGVTSADEQRRSREGAAWSLWEGDQESQRRQWEANHPRNPLPFCTQLWAPQGPSYGCHERTTLSLALDWVQPMGGPDRRWMGDRCQVWGIIPPAPFPPDCRLGAPTTDHCSEKAAVSEFWLPHSSFAAPDLAVVPALHCCSSGCPATSSWLPLVLCTAL